MKRILTLLSLLALILVNTTTSAQAPHRNPWVWGVGLGATFQTSDMHPEAGLGWDITAAKYTRVQAKSPIFLGARFRFLDGRNYGYNYHQNYGLLNNTAVNGTNNGPNYINNGGYIFSNYKFRFDELAFELVVGSNTLRKRGVLLYGFGGVGMTYWKTKTNVLDANGEYYNYLTANIDTTSASAAETGLDGLWDNTYETNADGSKSAQWSFMANAGFGFGYQFKNSLAIGIEHRTTFARNDIIDGQQWNSMNAPTGNNDMYHYTGVFLRWSFHRAEETYDQTLLPPPPTPVVTNTNQNPNNNNNNNNVVVNNPDNNTNTNNTNTNTNNDNNTQTGFPPRVTFTTPATDPYTTNNPSQTLVVRVDNVTSANQISLSINNQAVPRTTFSYNTTTNTMTWGHNLQNGTNVYTVTATNGYGTATESQTIVLNTSMPSGIPPTVNITTPSSNPFTSLTSTTSVIATVNNVTASNQIVVKQNGNVISGWNFSSTSHQVSLVPTLVNGNNSIEIIATNNYGAASDATVIIYKPNSQPTGQPPVVTITNPSACPYSTKTQALTITATVTNVTQASDITVLFNNATVTNFSFNAQTHVVSFPVTLVAGANPFSIAATNAYGRDMASCVVTYKPQQSGTPPTVNITVPSADPYTSVTATTNVTATVLNVTSANEIVVKQNGNVLSGWNFDANTHVVSFTASLISGNNTVDVIATNAYGTANDASVIIFKPVTQPTGQPPVVTITNPSACPYTTKAQAMTISATVTNVTQASEIAILFNNAPVTNFTFNAQTHVVTFPVNLVNGNNPFSITGTNAYGHDDANCVITYKPVTQPTGQPPVVTITNPSACPSQTTVAGMTISATVTNVTQASEIAVLFNNTAVTNFTFNAQTHVVTFPVNLVNGNNTFSITGTNAFGSDNANCVITYKPQSGPPPTVNITTPSTTTFNTTTAQANVVATVMNVTASSQIVVSHGNAHPNFSFNAATHQVTINDVLLAGQNVYVITATNQYGTANDQVTIVYINPTSGNGNSNNGGSNASTSGGQGRPTDTTSSGGSSATTSGGQGRPGSGNSGPSPIVLDPTITLVTPSTNTYTTNSSTLAVTMQVMNIMNSTDIRVRVNGVLTTFNFNPSTHQLTFTAPLNSGSNTIAVRAQNATGYAQTSITVTYTATSRTVNPETKPKTTTAPAEVKKGGDTAKTTTSGGRPAIKPASTTTTRPK